MEVGTVVWHEGKQRMGVVVPSIIEEPKDGWVMVDFDGLSGEYSCKLEELEAKERIEVLFHPERCKGCVYANSICHRYNPQRVVWLLSRRPGHSRIPIAMYPRCQQEG